MEEKYLTLPSGAIFKIRELTIIDYINNNILDIPFFYNKKEKEVKSNISNQKNENSLNEEKFNKWFTLIKFIFTNSIISPKIIFDKSTEDYYKNYLLFSELDHKDKEFLINTLYINNVEKMLEFFKSDFCSLIDIISQRYGLNPISILNMNLQNFNLLGGICLSGLNKEKEHAQEMKSNNKRFGKKNVSIVNPVITDNKLIIGDMSFERQVVAEPQKK